MHISSAQLDLFKELVNIGVGKAAGLINQMVNAHVSLELPEVNVLEAGQVASRLEGDGHKELSAVRLGFKGAFTGWAGLIFPKQSASWLVSQLIGQDFPGGSMDFDSLRIGTIQEVGNIVLNGVMGSIVNVLGESIDYYPPDYFESGLDTLISDDEKTDRVVVMIKARFRMEDDAAEGDILILFHVTAFAKLLAAMDRMFEGLGA
jgi:chemotaxis protein CheC